MEWAFYPAELRHLQVTALYMAGEWDASLAEADELARVPEMAAHVRAAGLLVQVGRGTRRRASGWRGRAALVPRLNTHVLLTLVTAAAEIDLAAWAGDPETAVDVRRPGVAPAAGAVDHRPPRGAPAVRDRAGAGGRRRGRRPAGR